MGRSFQVFRPTSNLLPEGGSPFWANCPFNSSQVYPGSAKIIVRRFDGLMAFVPEGRHDRSLARSAWESVPRKNRPVGYGMTGRS